MIITIKFLALTDLKKQNIPMSAMILAKNYSPYSVLRKLNKIYQILAMILTLLLLKINILETLYLDTYISRTKNVIVIF